MAIEINGNILEALTKAKIKIKAGADEISEPLGPIPFRVDSENVIMGFETVTNDFGDKKEQKPIMLKDYIVSEKQIDELFENTKEASK